MFYIIKKLKDYSDWGIVNINNDSFKELRFSNIYFDKVLDDRFLDKNPYQSEIIEEIKPVLNNLINRALIKYKRTEFIKQGLILYVKKLLFLLI